MNAPIPTQSIEHAKLQKIVRVLVDRVERDMDSQGSAFGLFQTAVVLEHKVRERTAELLKLNTQLMHEIGERRRAEEAARAAKAEAEQANLSKTKFLAAASHDLYQPLHAARLFLAALANGRLAPQQLDQVSRIGAALGAVDSLLNALLEISKLDAGVWLAQPSDFALGPLLERLAVECSAHAHHVKLKVATSSAVVRTDSQLLERTLRNFICNALRYTEKGKVLIGCRRRRDGVAIEIWDTGIGIPADELQRIFQEFYRRDAGREGIGKGLGLGLAVVERIAKLLGHKIEVESEVGRGSKFAIVVPYGDRKLSRRSGKRQFDTARYGGIAGKAIVVIDGDRADLDVIESAVRSWDCVPVVAANTSEARLKLAVMGIQPDLVIADYGPAGDPSGPAAVKALRAEFGVRIPGLLISGEIGPEARRAAKAAGCKFLPKPTKPAKLRAIVGHLLTEIVSLCAVTACEAAAT
jgi:two-component system, sensor histidine kinase